MMELAPSRDQGDPTRSPVAVGHDIARMLAGEGMNGAANDDLFWSISFPGKPLPQYQTHRNRAADARHMHARSASQGSFDVARTSAHGRGSVPQARSSARGLQFLRHRDEIMQLQRAGIRSTSAEALLDRMLNKIHDLRDERDKLRGEQHPIGKGDGAGEVVRRRGSSSDGHASNREYFLNKHLAGGARGGDVL